MGGSKLFWLLAIILILFYLFTAIAFAYEASGRIDAGSSTITSTFTTGQLPPSEQGSGGASATISEQSQITSSSSGGLESIGVALPLLPAGGGGVRCIMVSPEGEVSECRGIEVKEECTEINGEKMCAVPAPSIVESASPSLPPLEEYWNIERTVLSAMNEALAINPEHIFRLKISMNEEQGQEIPWEKLSFVYETENRAVIRGIDRDNNIMYLNAPANEIDRISRVWVVYLIEFDPAFEIPSFPKPELTKKPELETFSIDVNLEIENKSESITISKKAGADALIIDSNGIKAEISTPIRVDENGLKLEEKDVKVLPNQAVQRMRTQINATAKKISLSISQEVPVYEIQAVQKAKLLWIIPIELEIKTTVNAQTGEVGRIERPWWSFLVG